MMFYNHFDHLVIHPPWKNALFPDLLQILLGGPSDVFFLLITNRLTGSAVVEPLTCLDLYETQLPIPVSDDVDFPYDASFNTITR